MPYILRTLEPSVLTINYDLGHVLKKDIVLIELKIEIIICKPTNMRYVLMLKKELLHYLKYSKHRDVVCCRNYVVIY